MDKLNQSNKESSVLENIYTNQREQVTVKKENRQTRNTSLSILSLFLIINYLSPNMQALVMVLCSIYPIALWIKHRRVDTVLFLFLLFLFAGAVFTFINGSYRSLFYVISELKIIILFTLPSFFHVILVGKNHKKTLNHFFKYYVAITSVITTYGSVVLGLSRYTSFLDHSIYISVSLVLLLSYLYDSLSVKWILITLYSVFMLGSSNGIIIFFIVIICKSTFPVIYKFIPMIMGSTFSYWYVTVYRGRGVADGSFWNIDRVIIISTVVRYIREHFNSINYLFGFGIGKPLTGFRLVTQTYSDDIRGFVNWFHSITSEGVYPYSFHNELLRIFYNFGTVGILLLSLYVYKYIDKITFIALVVACLTNTIIYSTVGLFIISLIMAAGKLDDRKIREESGEKV